MIDATEAELDALTCDGPPLRTIDIARLTGFTLRFIQEEIETGELRAERVNGSGRWLIPRPHARVYLVRLGIIKTRATLLTPSR
jgi:hypothetical protein